ncbi:MAG TPA: SEC-C metal-binding domain-containing protein, partial [Methylomirabilota bacterium]|nr:SEC-C metal-binding domain-containing protein [Methylomirabilota bacterium]
TNMAGRGTDILLGGNADFLSKELLRKKGLDPATASPEARAAALDEARRVTEPEHQRVVERGGLHIVGTERHESRRIDNQLRGRSGRQGDPGSSRFYLSLEDDLLRIFGSQRIQKIMDRLGMEEGEPIEHKLVTRAIATAQKRVETHNFEIRKHLLEYDDVMNKQREIIYGMRRQILDGASQADTVAEWIDDLVGGTVDAYAPEGQHPEDWDMAGLQEALHRQFDVRPAPPADGPGSRAELEELVGAAVKARYEAREQELGADLLRALERHEMLIVIDTQWKDHLLSIDHLKEGIGLRGYGQRDPLTEYKKEAFDLFQDMVDRVKAAVVERLFKVQVVRDAPMELPAITAWADAQESRGALPSEPRPASAGGWPAARPQPVSRPQPAPRTPDGAKIGRNDPCYCGSGKKYKKCHLLQEGR